MKFVTMVADIREAIGKVLVDEEADRAYTIVDVLWDDKASAPMLVLKEREEDKK